MKKSTKKILTMGALLGAGSAFMMYKKKNPDYMNDIKDMAKNTASNVLSKLENME